MNEDFQTFKSFPKLTQIIRYDKSFLMYHLHIYFSEFYEHFLAHISFSTKSLHFCSSISNSTKDESKQQQDVGIFGKKLKSLQK